jgi:hypothetical protein
MLSLNDSTINLLRGKLTVPMLAFDMDFTYIQTRLCNMPVLPYRNIAKDKNLVNELFMRIYLINDGRLDGKIATVLAPLLCGPLQPVGRPGLLSVCLGLAQVISWVLFELRRANELLSGDHGF